jgi:hypothetical protein
MAERRSGGGGLANVWLVDVVLASVVSLGRPVRGGVWRSLQPQG